MRNQKKVAIYTRVSTKHQVDKDSLGMQRTDLPKYASLVLGIDDYEIFEDAGFSGKNTNRPSYQEMMERIHAGEFSHLLVWKIDRISRNLLDFAAMYKDLKSCDVVFVSKNEQFDTSSAMGEAMLKIILVFAELERNMASERVTATMIARASSGSYNGGPPPYGYHYDKELDNFVIYEPEAKVVRLIFKQYIYLKSLRKVCMYLHEHGIRSATGKDWAFSTVGQILRNPAYYGCLRYNRIGSSGTKDKEEWVLVPNHHEPIISEEVYQISNSILRSQLPIMKQGERGSYQRKHTHVFGGLISCACGSMMYPLWAKTKSGLEYSRYRCSDKLNGGECKKKNINDMTLGPFLINLIGNILTAKDSYTPKMKLTDLERILLRGDVFKSVSHITRSSLMSLMNALTLPYSGSDFLWKSPVDDLSESAETSYLINERAKVERALKRLNSLYLYSDDETIKEVDYISQYKQLQSDLDSIETKLMQLNSQAASEFNMTDEDFLNTATVFLLNQKLVSSETIDWVELYEVSDLQVLKHFFNSVLNGVICDNKRISSVSFRNGITLDFTY